MSKNRKQKMITPEIMRQAVVGAFTKLDPRYMMKNPVMFVVEIGFVISLVLSFAPGLLGDTTPNARVYNSIVSAILFVTVLFANFAESVAEGRGKAQAASLKKTKKDTQARLLDADGGERMVPSSELKKGDVVMVAAGGVIPGDGEVIEGIASVDESAITGESAPVVREAGGDFSSVTGGTTVVSDWLKVRITSDPGDSFLDRMIALVEGASRKKTPNEIALNTLLVSLTVIFLIVIVTLYPIALYSGVQLQTSTLIALMVCLIPTTIGGLLSAIGIAGMDRVTRFNVIAMSGKAVEACGDVDTMILDKTGTITYGNRLAADFFPVGGACREELVRCAALTSLHDGTPEGKSTLALARLQGEDCGEPQGARFIAFTAQTRMSGVDLPGGRSVRKGASDAIEKYVSEMGGKVPEDLARRVAEVSALGGTPLAVCEDSRILGVIYLKDTVKAGMAERFKRLRAIGIKNHYVHGRQPAYRRHDRQGGRRGRLHCRVQARRQDRIDQKRTGRGQDRCHDGRRHQRRARSGAGKRRPCDEQRYRRRQRGRKYGGPGQRPHENFGGGGDRQAAAYYPRQPYDVFPSPTTSQNTSQSSPLCL